jgi:hypothetical protein
VTERLRVLLQERQIGATLANGFEKIEAALPGGVRVFGGSRGVDEARPQGVEALAVARRQLHIAAALPEAVQAFEDRFRLAEAEAGQTFQRIILGDDFFPDAEQRVGAFFRLGKDFFEAARNDRPMPFENGQKRAPVGKSHRCGDLLAFLVSTWQAVRLGVVHVLQAVLEAAQEVVGSGQFVLVFWR